VRAFVDAVNKATPPGANVLRAAVSSTMGPAVRLNLGTLQNDAGGRDPTAKLGDLNASGRTIYTKKADLIGLAVGAPDETYSV
jgi:hypothetical protein